MVQRYRHKKYCQILLATYQRQYVILYDCQISLYGNNWKLSPYLSWELSLRQIGVEAVNKVLRYARLSEVRVEAAECWVGLVFIYDVAYISASERATPVRIKYLSLLLVIFLPPL